MDLHRNLAVHRRDVLPVRAWWDAMMVTQFRRRKYRDRHEPSFTDLALAFNAGFWTCAICAMVIVTLWR